MTRQHILPTAQSVGPDALDERARRAVRNFRTLQPTLTSYARILTGKQNVRVVMSTADNGSTDGTKINFRPPIALGDNTPHDRKLCDKRDEHKQQLCAACGIRESVMAIIYHEIGHIAGDSFAESTEEERAQLVERAVREAGGRYADAIADKIKRTPDHMKADYLNMARLVSPFLPYIVNCLEDARVNRMVFKTRKGIKPMFEAQNYKTFTEGVRQPDNSIMLWRDYPLNMQVSVALFSVASGIMPDNWFVPEVEAAVRDEQVLALCRKIETVRSVGAVYELSFPILARLRELGFFKSESDPEPEPEQEQEPDDAPEQDKSQPEPSEDEGGEGEAGEEDSGSPSAEPGEGAESGGETDDPPEDDGRGEGEGSDSSSGDSDDGSSDGGDDAGDQSDADGDADGSAGGDGDDASGDPSDRGSNESSTGDSGDSDAPDSNSTESGSDGSDDASDGSSGSDRPGQPDDQGSDRQDGQGGVDGAGEVGRGKESGEDTDASDGSSSGDEASYDDGESDGGSGGGTSDPTSEDDSSSGPDGGQDADADTEGEGRYSDRGDAGDGSSGLEDRAVDEAGRSERASDSLQDSGTQEEGEAVDGSAEGQAEADSEPDDSSSSEPSGPDSDDGRPSPLGGDGGDDAGVSSEPSSSGDMASADHPHSADSSGSDERVEQQQDDSGSVDSDGTDGEPDREADSSHDNSDVEVSSSDDAIESGADEGLGGVEVIQNSAFDELPMGTPDEVETALHEVIHPEDRPDHVYEEDGAATEIERAIMQGLYFETPSTNVFGVREHRFGSPVYAEMDHETVNMSQGWAHETYRAWGYNDKQLGISGEFHCDEKTLGPALLRMRVAFADNKRGKDIPNRKSGKVNARVLGKRAHSGDERLFKRRIMPGKRDYFVLIGIDISGSTIGTNIVLAKRAAMAQATLCARMGISFAVYAHSGNLHDPSNGRRSGVDLDIYHIKDPDEPWSEAVQERLLTIGPDAANLDGHTLEYYRKILDTRPETDRIILYYTDGKMPAENHDEELEILRREIRTCRRKNYTLLGVGIRTDSPVQHGLDTVQVDDDEDIVKVVKHLEKRLLDA